MYYVARTLVSLSTKGVLVALAVTFTICAVLGYFVSPWIFYVPMAFMGLRMAFVAKTVIGSAMNVGWSCTLGELIRAIQQVKQELEAEDARQECLGKLQAGESEHPRLAIVPPLPKETENKPERPRLRAINGGKK